MIEKLTVVVEADARKGRREIDNFSGSIKQMNAATGAAAVQHGKAAKAADENAKAHGRTRTAVGGLSRGFGGMLIQTAGIIGIAEAGQRVKEEWTEAEIVGKRTDQVIRTMGAGSWITAGQVGDLSAELSKKQGIDDEQIQSNANLLLTFGQVRNEAGKGNDVFNQAVGLTEDLAEVMKTSGASSAKMLGKALNDPVKGMNAMTRAGVSFTAAEQKKIKALVKSGDTLAAQKLILEAVSEQVAGAAEGAKTPAKELDVAMGDLAETAGTTLMPAVNLLARGLIALAPVLAGVFTGVEHVSQEIQAGNPAYVAAAIVVGSLTAGFVAFRVALMIAGIVRGVAAAVWAVNAAMYANPVGAVVAGIVALGVALVLAYRKIGWFRDGVNAVFGFVRDHWPLILSILTGPIGAAVIYIVRHWEQVRAKVSSVFGFIRTAGATVWDGFKSGVTDALNWVIGKLNWFVEKYNATIGKIAGSIDPIAEIGAPSSDIGTSSLPVVSGYEDGSVGVNSTSGGAYSGRSGSSAPRQRRTGSSAQRKARRQSFGAGRPEINTTVMIGGRAINREMTFMRRMDSGYSHAT